MARRKAKGGRRKAEDEGALLSGFYFLLSPFVFRLAFGHPALITKAGRLKSEPPIIKVAGGLLY